MVQAKKADQIGVSGGIIFNGEDVGIFYATNISNPGFQRFTVGHELGHYFLEGHPAEILKTGPLHASKAGFSQGDKAIEIEADHFSSGLLLPGHLVREALGDGQIGLEGIEALSEVSECSLTASAIRAAECSPYATDLCEQLANVVVCGFCHAPENARSANEVDTQLFIIPNTQWIGAEFACKFWRMLAIGSRVEETGTLIRAGGGFVLRRDIGGRWKLDLHRVPVDHVEKRVRISGIIVADGLVDVDALGPNHLIQ